MQQNSTVAKIGTCLCTLVVISLTGKNSRKILCPQTFSYTSHEKFMEMLYNKKKLNG